MLNSQKVRGLAPEMDPLKLGMGWKVNDLSKPQVIVESTFGDSHPGSAHLLGLVEAAVKGINDRGGKILCHRHMRRYVTGSRRH